MTTIAEFIAIKATEQLLCGFEWSDLDDLGKLFTQLHKVDANSHYQATSTDYAEVAQQFVDLMNQTLLADQSLWFFVDYGKLFTGCVISHHQFASENDYNFEFTLRFADVKRYNTVKMQLSKVWGADKFITELKFPANLKVFHDVTLDNFFEATTGEWVSCRVTDVPDRATVIQRSPSGSVQFTMPDEPETVYRISDHWGSGISQCNWYLSGFRRGNSFTFKDENGGKLFCGKIKLENLYII